MFNTLSERFSRTLKNLTGRGHLSEENIQEAVRELRIALLEADVALSVAKGFIEKLRERAIGQEVLGSLNPGQMFAKIVQEEMIALLGKEHNELAFNTQPPAVILLAGLQGSGKTTTAAKLALWIKKNLKKSVLLASTDTRRPAAIEQLALLAKNIETDFYEADPKTTPLSIAQAALQHAKLTHKEVLIIDTAGRLHVDTELMTEIQALHQTLEPIETLFVVDSMTGQDAANTAKAFHEALPLTGLILSKMDGDARGGAALSIVYLTQCPIKFIGIGEKSDALDAFYPDRLVSRILGQGDLLSLLEEAEKKLDRQEATALANKVKKGKGFDFEDFLTQLQQMKKMGGLAGLLDKIPGMGGGIAALTKQKINDKTLIHYEAMVHSMTPKERQFPDLIRGSRKHRIATGSGTSVQAVNQLLKQFSHMQKMMKKFSKGGMHKMMRQIQHRMPGMGGGMPF